MPLFIPNSKRAVISINKSMKNTIIVNLDKDSEIVLVNYFGERDRIGNRNTRSYTLSDNKSVKFIKITRLKNG